MVDDRACHEADGLGKVVRIFQIAWCQIQTQGLSDGILQCVIIERRSDLLVIGDDYIQILHLIPAHGGGTAVFRGHNAILIYLHRHIFFLAMNPNCPCAADKAQQAHAAAEAHNRRAGFGNGRNQPCDQPNHAENHKDDAAPQITFAADFRRAVFSNWRT